MHSTARSKILPIVATTTRLAALRAIARDNPSVAARIVLDRASCPPRVVVGGAEDGGTLPTLVALFAHGGVQRSSQLLLGVIQTLCELQGSCPSAGECIVCASYRSLSCEPVSQF